MATTLEPVNANCIATDRLRLEGVSNRSTLVNYPDPRCFQLRKVLFRISSGGFHNLDPGFYDDLETRP